MPQDWKNQRDALTPNHKRRNSPPRQDQLMIFPAREILANPTPPQARLDRPCELQNSTRTASERRRSPADCTSIANTAGSGDLGDA